MKRMMRRAGASLTAALVAAAASGCMGASTGPVATIGAPPSATAPSDDVFLLLLRSIEERRAERFAAAVDPTCTPSRDEFWTNLNTFLGTADNIEYNVSVERRVAEGDRVVYIFTWQRKHSDHETGEVRSLAGRSEWTLSRASGRFLLAQATGTALF